jgi:hypothetical protein
MLTHLGIPQKKEDKKGKPFRLSLAKRLELALSNSSLPAVNVLDDPLSALRILGNSGSHDNDKIELDDALDAYEILETVLYDLYYQKPDREAVDEKVKKICEIEDPLSVVKKNLKPKSLFAF